MGLSLVDKLKRVGRRAVLTGLTGAMLLGACSKTNKITPPDDGGNGGDGGGTTEFVIKSENTSILSPTTLDNLSSYSDGRFIFSETTDELMQLSVGSFITGATSEKTPDGFLREIDYISPDKKIMNTSVGSLEEAIKDGYFTIEKKLTPSGLFKALQGVYQKPSFPGGFDFNLYLDDVVLYDNDGNPNTTGDQIKANGNISFNSNFYLEVKIDDNKLKKFVFKNISNEEVDIELTAATSELGIHEEVEIASYYLSPFVVWISSFPIVVTPQIEVNVSLDGDVSTNITSGITQSASLEAGVSYENSKWSPIHDFLNDFEFNPPVLSASAEFKLSGGPELNFLMYGVVGPSAQVKGYLRLDADIQRTPWWQFFGGVEAFAGAEAEVLGIGIVDYSVKVIEYEELLAQAEESSLIARLVVTPERGNAPLETLQDARSSTGENITECKFDFDGNGTTDYTETSSNAPDGNFDKTTEHTYQNVGNYTPKVTIKDNLGRTSSATDNVVVGERNWQIVYETDFSSDPGWATNNTSRYYWHAASQTFFTNNYTNSQQWATTDLDYNGESFRLIFDVKPVRNSGEDGDANIGLFGPTKVSNSNNNREERLYVLIGGYVNQVLMAGYNSGGEIIYSGAGNNLMLNNAWHHVEILYDRESKTISLEVTRDGRPVLNYDTTMNYGFTNSLNYFGASMVGSWLESGRHEIAYIDNVSLAFR